MFEFNRLSQKEKELIRLIRKNPKKYLYVDEEEDSDHYYTTFRLNKEALPEIDLKTEINLLRYINNNEWFKNIKEKMEYTLYDSLPLTK